MAILKKDGKEAILRRGVYIGRIIDFSSKGLKKTKKGDVFENGYLDIVLNNGVSLTQYIMIMPYTKCIFFKFVNALGLSHKIDDYVDFPFCEMFEKEVLIELEYESVRGGRYLNITNVYSLEEADEFIEYQRARDELNRRNNMLSMDMIEAINQSSFNVEVEYENNEKSEIVENEIGFGDEYDKFIGD